MVVCGACGEENPERARFCLNCATPLVMAAAIRDVRKTVTVLFADVSGSTSLGEQLDPESLRALMSRYFAAIKQVVERHGGTVEKFIGDAVMAVFGIPILHEDDALRAVRAAVQIRDAVATLNSEPQTGRGVALAFRTGLNTGEVVAGDPDADQTLVTGDAVNTAARLEQAAAPGEILLGQATYRLVRDAVTVESVESIAAKGKTQPLRAYRLLKVSGDAGHARHLDAPMVGREAELGRLQQAFAQAVKDRSCYLFTLLGTAGVGKSRLVAEFLASIGEGAKVLAGRCLPYGEGITYWPVAEVLREAATIDEADSLQAAKAKVEALLSGERDANAVAEAVSSAIGLSSQAAPQEEIFWATRKLFEHLARHQPLVVVFEDIHWAEPTFLDLVEHIADLSRDAPLFILCPARPELLDRRAGWGGGKLNATAILLEALPAGACDQLIRELPGGRSLPEPVCERILAAAEGNPLYLEEMLGMLVEEGLLVPANGGWLAAPELDTAHVPPTIQALLAARLEQLAPNERAVAERAAVVGRVFEQAAVAELTPEALRPEVARSLVALVRKELVRPERSELVAGDAFKFRHILIRDAAYDALPKIERADLHERFAQWLKRAAADRLLEFEEIVGYHFEQAWRYRRELGFDDEVTANVGDAAAGHLAAAAFRALDRSDLPAAAQLLDRVLHTISNEDSRLVELTVERVDVLMQLGRLQEAGRLLEGARDLPAVRTDPRQRAWWELAQLRVAYFGGPAGGGYQIDAAMPIVDQAIAEFESADDNRGLAHAWLNKAQAHWWPLQVAASIAALEQALTYSRQAGRRSQELSILDWLARAYWLGPSPVARTLAQLEGIRRSADGDRRIEATVRLSRASLFGVAGRTDDAERELDAALLTYGELGMVVSIGEAGQAGYWLGLGSGDLEPARRRMEDANRQLEAIGETGWLSTNLALLAFLLLDLGELDEAEQVARRGLSIASPDDISAVGLGRLALASSDAQRGNAGGAVQVVEELIGRVSASDCDVVVGDWLSRAARIYLADGNRERATTLFGDALGRYRQKGASGLAAVLERRIASLGIGLLVDE
jgi:class 3 adenylate cyclase/tetratricopeptide (TPR) repeat protein